MVTFLVKYVVNICGKNCGEIEKLSDWNKNWCGKITTTTKKHKNTEPSDSRTRGPAAPAVLVYIHVWNTALGAQKGHDKLSSGARIRGAVTQNST